MMHELWKIGDFVGFIEQPDLASTRALPCFESAGRVEKFTLFLGDPECLGLNRG